MSSTYFHHTPERDLETTGRDLEASRLYEPVATPGNGSRAPRKKAVAHVPYCTYCPLSDQVRAQGGRRAVGSGVGRATVVAVAVGALAGVLFAVAERTDEQNGSRNGLGGAETVVERLEVDAAAGGEAPPQKLVPSAPRNPSDAERHAIVQAFEQAFNPLSHTEETLEAVEGGSDLLALAEAARAATEGIPSVGIEVRDITIYENPALSAGLTLSFVTANGEALTDEIAGEAIHVDGMWLVSRVTYCRAIALANVHCNP